MCLIRNPSKSSHLLVAEATELIQSREELQPAPPGLLTHLCPGRSAPPGSSGVTCRLCYVWRMAAWVSIPPRSGLSCTRSCSSQVFVGSGEPQRSFSPNSWCSPPPPGWRSHPLQLRISSGSPFKTHPHLPRPSTLKAARVSVMVTQTSCGSAF